MAIISVRTGLFTHRDALMHAVDNAAKWLEGGHRMGISYADFK